MNLNKFAVRLKTSRIQKGLSQKDLSEKTDISQALISKYESEKNNSSPSAVSVYILSRALCVNCEYLLGIEERTAISPRLPQQKRAQVKKIENYSTSKVGRRFEFVRMPVEYPGDFFITQEDNALFPLLKKNDILFFKTGERLEHDKIVIFRKKNTEGNIVRFCKIDDIVELKALNGEYGSFRLKKAEFHTKYNVLGTLSGYWKNI